MLNSTIVLRAGTVLLGLAVIAGCDGSGGGGDNAAAAPQNDPPIEDPPADPAVDITNAVFDETSGDCADYVNSYGASVMDITRSLGFDANVIIAADDTTCALSSNNIPNHDFNDNTGRFATQVSEVDRVFAISRNPAPAGTTTGRTDTT